MIFYRRAGAGGSWRAACCFWLFSSLSSGFKIWIWIFMIENNRGYKNKSLQSWAVSYRGKQCLPHQRSPKTLASSLTPIKKPIAPQPSPSKQCWRVLMSTQYVVKKKKSYLVQFRFVSTQNKRKHICHRGEIVWLVSNIVSLVFRLKQVTVFVTDRWITPLVSASYHLTQGKCFKHAGLHLKQVTLRLPFDSFFPHFFIEYLDVKIQYQTHDSNILENRGNEMLLAVLLLSV